VPISGVKSKRKAWSYATALPLEGNVYRVLPLIPYGTFSLYRVNTGVRSDRVSDGDGVKLRLPYTPQAFAAPGVPNA